MADHIVIHEAGQEPIDVPEGQSPDYYRLPESMRAQTPYEQWQWLSDAEKGRFMQTETEPETEL